MKALLNRLMASLLGISFKVIEPMIPIFRSRIGNIISAAIPIALEYVVQASLQRNWSGSQKRDYVKNAVGNILISEGIAAAGEISNSLLDTIAQNAYMVAKVEKRVAP